MMKKKQKKKKKKKKKSNNKKKTITITITCVVKVLGMSSSDVLFWSRFDPLDLQSSGSPVEGITLQKSHPLSFARAGRGHSHRCLAIHHVYDHNTS